MRVFITTLAAYQTGFWIGVSKSMAACGYRPTLLAFDEPSHEMAQSAGIDSFNAQQVEPTGESFANAASRLRLLNPNLLFSHERVAFGLRDSAALERKFLRYLAAAESCLDSRDSVGGPPSVIQELGGFLSVAATYYAARARGIDNVFLEPSFFRGRFFVTLNSYRAYRVRGRASPTADLLDYLRNTVANQAIVVPIKDRTHYRPPLRKVFSIPNARRLLQKLTDIHIHGKRYEFGYVGHHVRTHIQQLTNSVALRGLYTELNEVGHFVYYPLHVPGDVALTLRSPEYADQLSLVEYVASHVPRTHCVVLKEHPAMVGALQLPRIRALLRKHDNIALLPPSVNNFDVLRRTDLVLSINSKAGAEAIMLGKPVVVLGDAFYRESGLVYPIDRLGDLGDVLGKILEHPPQHRSDEVYSFFQAVWNSTWKGELYDERAQNVADFAASLMAALMPANKKPSALSLP